MNTNTSMSTSRALAAFMNVDELIRIHHQLLSYQGSYQGTSSEDADPWLKAAHNECRAALYNELIERSLLGVPNAVIYVRARRREKNAQAAREARNTHPSEEN